VHPLPLPIAAAWKKEEEEEARVSVRGEEVTQQQLAGLSLLTKLACTKPSL
jgi:hypothetical protein